MAIDAKVDGGFTKNLRETSTPIKVKNPAKQRTTTVFFSVTTVFEGNLRSRLSFLRDFSTGERSACVPEDPVAFKRDEQTD